MTETLKSTPFKLSERIVKYVDLKPCLNAFIDTRTPGSDKKENFTIIGPGVAENPDQHVHISEAHGFNIGGARQPPGCTNSQHSHDTVEVFYVHAGTWAFTLGEDGTDARIELGPGDLISIPTRVFRGFTNIGKDIGYLWAVLGKDDPGRVLWAPKVFELAQEYGLALLEDGSLIDTANGEVIPAGKQAMPVTSREQVEALQNFSDAQLEACVVRAAAKQEAGIFNNIEGILDRRLVGQSPIDWEHEFSINELTLSPGAKIPCHHFDVPDVYFVHSGNVVIELNDGEKTILSAGDTLTIPKGCQRRFTNASNEACKLVAVRGGDGIPNLNWS